MARKPQVVNLSQETLDQITPALHSMRDSLKNQTRLLTDTFNLQTNELRAAERRRNLAQSQADGQAAALAAAAATPASPAATGGQGGGGGTAQHAGGGGGFSEGGSGYQGQAFVSGGSGAQASLAGGAPDWSGAPRAADTVVFHS